MKYPSGQDVKIGDRVKLWDDQYGTVVCSVETGEFSKEYPKAEWGYLKSGIIVKTDTGEVFHYTEADEDFELIGLRGAP
jgi:hypothetical protein